MDPRVCLCGSLFGALKSSKIMNQVLWPDRSRILSCNQGKWWAVLCSGASEAGLLDVLCSFPCAPHQRSWKLYLVIAGLCISFPDWSEWRNQLQAQQDSLWSWLKPTHSPSSLADGYTDCFKNNQLCLQTRPLKTMPFEGPKQWAT